MPDGELARKETIVQTEVARCGFPTPIVRASGGPDAGLGRPFLVMDRAEGTHPLDGLGVVRALRRLPVLWRDIPDTLAVTMSELHRLDAGPLRRLLEEAGVVATVPQMLDVFTARAEAFARPDVVSAIGWLAANPPPEAPDVICHGDLHPFNVLVDGSGQVSVLDWSASLVAPAAYDVAFTSLVMSEPPIETGAGLQRVVHAAGRALSRRFVRRYREYGGSHIDTQSLTWYQAVVCARCLVEVAGWTYAGELDDHAGHPWLGAAAAFAARLSALTGVSVRPL